MVFNCGLCKDDSVGVGLVACVPCGHVFCEGCFSTLCQWRQFPQARVCPECHTHVRMHQKIIVCRSANSQSVSIKQFIAWFRKQRFDLHMLKNRTAECIGSCRGYWKLSLSRIKALLRLTVALVISIAAFLIVGHFILHTQGKVSEVWPQVLVMLQGTVSRLFFSCVSLVSRPLESLWVCGKEILFMLLDITSVAATEIFFAIPLDLLRIAWLFMETNGQLFWLLYNHRSLLSSIATLQGCVAPLVVGVLFFLLSKNLLSER